MILAHCGLASCNNLIIDNRNEEEELTEKPDPLQTGEVRIKACPDEDYRISFIVEAETVSIDWGDGTTEDHIPNGLPEGFVHNYEDQSPKHITIRTEKMEAFGACTIVSANIGIIRTFGFLEEIAFGKCPQLEEVILRQFHSLPAASDESIIIYRENTGSATCDIDIALSKGWEARTTLPDEVKETIEIEIDDDMLINLANFAFSSIGDF